ncbi:hypothetical protein ACOZ4N_15295 [Halorientalis pallida]|uniref:hypothetical protein n=1 Tax=Halorientalis pallida TaxID=2479928 RepID=UPI003C6F6CF2
MALSELWALEMLVAAFAGGAFGAAIGALPSFALAGLFVVVGELYALAARTVGVETLPVDVTGSVAFGVVLGPHVAFGGGAAALAYATKRGYLDTDFEYHQAKEVTRGLGSDPDVLAVGGLFGVVGYWIATASASLAVPVDPVALGVVGSALAHRVAFGYSLVGAGPRRWFDMRPYERAEEGQSETLADGGERSEAPRSTSDTQSDGGPASGASGASSDTQSDGGPASGASGASSDTQSDGGVRRVEPWLPYQYRWPNVAMLGLVVGVLGAYVAYLTASPFLAFGLSVVALVFLNADVAEIPVTHHIALPASTAVLALVEPTAGPLTPGLVTGAVPLGQALLVGALFGLVGALLGEVTQRIFYAHAETHLDPPAASIVLTSLLIGLLAIAGVLPSAVWIPTP